MALSNRPLLAHALARSRRASTRSGRTCKAAVKSSIPESRSPCSTSNRPRPTRAPTWSGSGAMDEGHGIEGLDAQGATVIGNGALVLPGRLVSVSALAVGQGTRRIELDDLGVIGNGALAVARAHQGIASFLQGLGVERSP